MWFKSRLGVRSQFRGTSPHRYKDDPLEEEFAKAWQEAHVGPIGACRGYLDCLMDVNNKGYPNPPLTDRDWLVAATVIQWLGSPVGQYWLAEILGTSAHAQAFDDEYRTRRRVKGG